MSFLKKNSMILVLMILALGGAAYWFTMRGDGGEEATVVITEQGGAVQQSDNAELAQRLALLASLSIRRDIFDNPAFQRLQPNLVDVPRPVFRNQNPFAPIGQRSDRFATGTTPGLSNPVPGLGAIPIPGSATTSQIQRLQSLPSSGSN
jgi:hypothetical protein